MKTVPVVLDSIDKIKDFANTVSHISCRTELVSGKYAIDAKSVMSIFSLDLSKPVMLNLYANDEELPRILPLLAHFTAE